MDMTRRGFIGFSGAALAFAAAGRAGAAFAAPAPRSKIALQLYSIRSYIKKNGLAKALDEVARIGYQGVEFAGYYGHKPSELRKMLADSGLEVCGTHVGRDAFSPEKISATLDFELEYGNRFVCCPGGGNAPKGYDWSGQPQKGKKAPNPRKTMDFMKKLVEYYNTAAETAGKRGALIGLHNHMWEFNIRLPEGRNYWDYFFSNTSKKVQMEQDVGWTTCAGFDPCEQYRKYPHRSFTLHAKENGMGPDVKEFDAILGRPGVPGAKGVDWDRLFKATDADGVKWYVVECEKHEDSFDAARPSFEFLKSKGRVPARKA